MSNKKFKFDVVIYANGLPFDGDTIKEKSLGGSESAAYYMGKELAALGHHVTLFSNCEKPGVFDDVRYMPLGQNSKNFFDYMMTEIVDVCIVERAPQMFNAPLNSKLNILWAHDVMLKRFGNDLFSGLWNVDSVFLLSDFHKKQWKTVFDLPDELFWKTRNGIGPVVLDKKIKRKKKRLFYSGRPERGLIYLADIMPLVWQTDPEIEFCYATYAFPGLITLENGQQVPEDALLKSIEEKLKQHGGDKVKLLGKLTKADLYKEMQKSSLYVYPAEFEEISCISTMEAMMCGLPFLANARGALPETLHPRAGELIGTGEDGEVKTPLFKRQFAEKIVNLVNNPEKLARMSRAGVKHSESLSWKLLAEQWDEKFHEMFEDKTLDKQRLAKHLWDAEDIMALKKLNLPNWNEEIAGEYKVLEGKESYQEEYDKESAHCQKKIYNRVLESITSPAHAQQYVQNVSNSPRAKVILEFLQKENEKTKFTHLLDYGCAEGQNTVAILNAFPELSATLADVSEGQLGSAQRLIERCCDLKTRKFVNFTKAIAPKETIPGAAKVPYDLVLCGEVLEHVEDPTAFINEVESLVADGTLIVYTTPLGLWKTNTLDRKEMGMLGHLWHFERQDLVSLFGEKKDFSAIAITAGPHSRSTGSLGWHLLMYRKDSKKKTGKVDLDRKLFVQSPRETLSVCVLTENCENLLHRTLKSVKHIADEIIVCDSGSTDSTLEICSEYTDKIIKIDSPLRTGFDVARNVSLAHARGDWVLWLDSDEELLSPFNVNKYLRNNCFNGYAIKQHHFSAQPPNAFEPDLPVRIFRHKKGIRFVGKIHEHPEIAVNKSVGQTHFMPDVDIAHDGYLTENGRKEKFFRNFELLKWDRQVNPDRVLGKFLFLRDLVHLARYSLEQSRGAMTQEAVYYCEEAIKLFRAEFISGSALLRNDGLKYYSEALLFLNKGIDITFAFDIPGMTQPQIGAKPPITQTFRFASKEDFLAFYAGIVTPRMDMLTGKYV